MAVDWLKIKTDYISGLGNYRELSEKYGVSQSTIRKRAAAEKWSDAKETQRNKIGTKLEQQTAEIIVEQEANRVTRLLSLSDRLADRIEQAIQELDQMQVTHKKKTRTVEYKDHGAPGKPTKEIVSEEEQLLAIQSIVDRKGLQQVASALKNLWEIGKNAVENPGVADDGFVEALNGTAGEVWPDGDTGDIPV